MQITASFVSDFCLATQVLLWSSCKSTCCRLTVCQLSGSHPCSSPVLDPGLKCKLACMCPCIKELLLVLGLKGHFCRWACQAAIYRTCHEQYHQKSEPLHEGA